MKPKVRRLTLKGWTTLDDLRKELEEHAKAQEFVQAAALVRKIIQLSTGKKPRNKFWLDDALLFIEILSVNSPKKDFPILTSKQQGKPLPWEYSGRMWYFWLNTLAKKYGWSEVEIAKMDIDDCIGLYQEIVADEQYEREWQNSLSEVAYAYNKSTKTSKLVELPKPDWMRPAPKKAQPVKTVSMPARAVPMGVVLALDENNGKH